MSGVRTSAGYCPIFANVAPRLPPIDLGAGNGGIPTGKRPCLLMQAFSTILAGMATSNLKAATFRLEPEILEGLEAVRVRDGVSITEQVRRALRTWLELKGVPEKAAPRRAATRRKA